MTLILTNDLDIYEHDLDTLKMYLHTKNEVYRPRLSNIKASTGQTDRQTWLNRWWAVFVSGKSVVYSQYINQVWASIASLQFKAEISRHHLPVRLDTSSVEWLTALEWVRFWCLARSDALLNALLHPGYSQRYGFSPVCERKWVLRFSSREYALLQPSNCTQTDTQLHATMDRQRMVQM